MKQILLLTSVMSFLFTFTITNVYAQGDYQVQAGITPEELVSILTGNLIQTSNITYTGHTNAKGRFWGTSNIGMESGIILASGLVENSVGPNNTSNKSSDFNLPGDQDLTSLGYMGSHDASVLEFDFVPTENIFSIKLALGSEEYPEYCNTSFSDVMGIFLSGPGISGPFSSPPEYPNGSKNIAIIDTIISLYIGINNINNGQTNNGPCENCQYYINNGVGTTPSVNPYIQYDGLTTVFEIGSVVVPNETYHLKIAVSDIGDGSYDSGIFLATGSLITAGKSYDLPQPSLRIEGNILKVIGKNDLKDASLSIYTLTGNILYEGRIAGTEFSMSIEDYPAGIYLVKLSKAGISYNCKILR